MRFLVHSLNNLIEFSNEPLRPDSLSCKFKNNSFDYRSHIYNSILISEILSLPCYIKNKMIINCGAQISLHLS